MCGGVCWRRDCFVWWLDERERVGPPASQRGEAASHRSRLTHARSLGRGRTAEPRRPQGGCRLGSGPGGRASDGGRARGGAAGAPLFSPFRPPSATFFFFLPAAGIGRRPGRASLCFFGTAAGGGCRTRLASRHTPACGRVPCPCSTAKGLGVVGADTARRPPSVDPWQRAPGGASGARPPGTRRRVGAGTNHSLRRLVSTARRHPHHAHTRAHEATPVLPQPPKDTPPHPHTHTLTGTAAGESARARRARARRRRRRPAPAAPGCTRPPSPPCPAGAGGPGTPT